jgi:hypothetical protein
MCATQPTWFLLKAPVAELPAALGIFAASLELGIFLLGAALRVLSIVDD